MGELSKSRQMLNLTADKILRSLCTLKNIFTYLRLAMYHTPATRNTIMKTAQDTTTAITILTLSEFFVSEKYKLRCHRKDKLNDPISA